MSKKGFTIVELLVAMALLVMMVALSAVVFSTAVKAYRTANATTEIMSRMRALTEQLDSDLQGLRKDGEFILVWAPSAKINSDGSISDKDNDDYADEYLSFDRLMFFSIGNFACYKNQPTTAPNTFDVLSGVNRIARICYSFSRTPMGYQAAYELNPSKRIFCRTQHMISTTTGSNLNLMPFPDVTAWDQTKYDTFYMYNSLYEYQTILMSDWTAMSNPMSSDWQAKKDMLSAILDVEVRLSPTDGPSSWYKQGGPKVNLDDPNTLHQLFLQGIGQFRVQIWDSTLNRWMPEIDPNGDGNYSDSDYQPISQSLAISLQNRKVPVWWFPLFSNNFDNIGPALKFTFTIYDSKGIFPEGKTFTHIVYLK